MGDRAAFFYHPKSDLFCNITTVQSAASVTESIPTIVQYHADKIMKEKKVSAKEAFVAAADKVFTTITKYIHISSVDDGKPENIVMGAQSKRQPDHRRMNKSFAKIVEDYPHLDYTGIHAYYDAEEPEVIRFYTEGAVRGGKVNGHAKWRDTYTADDYAKEKKR